ncbi:MAG: DUF1592 domain-containing protein [Bryobacterales bacterium]|nr:DUF1592 domain-containing protein [Bryobacterales bacterium]
MCVHAQDFKKADAFLKQYCAGCHQPKSALGGFDVSIMTEASFNERPRLWSKALSRVREHEMPPVNAAKPPLEERESFTAFVDKSLRTAACGDGIQAARALTKRLNRAEFGATVGHLLNIHVNAGAALPNEGAGGEGFDNAAETLFLSPVHAEKYLDAAKIAMDYAMSDPRSRAVFLPAEPGEGISPEEAARKVIALNLPRAFRRGVTDAEIEKYMAYFRRSQKKGDSFRTSISYALQAVLISPNFLFRIEEPNTSTEPRLVPDYQMASRLSYFLWGSMPDDTLLDLAKAGKLQDPEVLKTEVQRMLKAEKTREFAENFVEQWLNTRELGRDIKPDEKLFPEYYDQETTSGIRYEPILFFQEIIQNDLSLLELIDSNWTVMSNKLQKFYGHAATKGLRQQPRRVDLPASAGYRGGLLGMTAILAVTSMPTRTSPVLRGKWIMDAMLGTPAPPPPPNVPGLDTAHKEGAAPKSIRERLEQHRQNPNCAGCHNRIDPWGFALENFDVMGKWRTEDMGAPVDAKSKLPDGTVIEGVQGLKNLLMERKDLVIRNLTSKMMGYALGRSLTLEDYCAVDAIVEKLKKERYSSQALIREIVLSTPFRYQAGEGAKPQVSSATKREATK